MLLNSNSNESVGGPSRGYRRMRSAQGEACSDDTGEGRSSAIKLWHRVAPGDRYRYGLHCKRFGYNRPMRRAATLLCALVGCLWALYSNVGRAQENKPPSPLVSEQ